MKKKSKTFLLMFLAFLIYLPGSLVISKILTTPTSNSIISKLPEFTTSLEGNRILLTEYINNNNPLRKPSISANAWINLKAFNDSTTDQVVQGRDGWLFYKNTINTPCGKHDDVAKNIAALNNVGKILSENGKSFSITLAPNKYTIYPNFFNITEGSSQYCAKRENTILQKKLENLDENIYINSFNLLQKAKGEHPEIALYTKKDTHWTTYGSGLFVQSLMEKIRVDAKKETRLEHAKTIQVTGDLTQMIGLPSTETRESHEFVPTKNTESTFYDIITEKSRYTHIKTTPKTNLISKRVLVLHDSFFYYTWKHLSGFFDEVLYVQWHHYDQDELTSLMAAADIVIIESVERNAQKWFTSVLTPNTFLDSLQNKMTSQEEEIKKWDKLVESSTPAQINTSHWWY